MDDFSKYFKDNLENQSAPEFQENDWSKMEKKLEADSSNRPLVGGLWWATLPIIGMLLFSNFHFYKKSQVVDSQTVVQKIIDTVYLKETIVHKDTIVLKEVPVYVQVPVYADINGFLNENSTSTIGHFSEQKFSAQTKETFQNDEIPSTEILPILESNFSDLKLEDPTFSTAKINTQKQKKHKSLRQIVYPMRPNAVGIGLRGGSAHSFAFGANGFSTGGELEFTTHAPLSLWVNAYYQRQFQKLYVMGADNSGVPFQPPPSAGFEFDSAEAKFRALQYGAGLRYRLSKNKWQPYLGAGFGVVKFLPHEVLYDFVNTTTGVELEQEYEVSGSQYFTQNLLLEGGLNYELSSQFQIGLNGVYRSHIANLQYPLSNTLSVQLGAKYFLK